MKEIDIPDGWKKVKLKDVIKEVNQRNKGEKVKRVLSVTNSKGFVTQDEYFEGTVHSANIANYKIVRKNQFAYNPSRVNVGSIDILKDYEDGALSPMYVVFEVDTTKLLPEYFKYYFQTNRFYENVKNNTQGSVRNSLNFKALTDFDYLLPPIEEQEKIVVILKIIDSIIEKYERLLEEKNQFIKSQFVEMFGDIVKGTKYSENQKSINDIAFVTKLAGFEFTDYIKYKDSGDIIMLRGLNCKSGKLVLDNIKWIDKETSDMLPRSKLFKGDILMTYAGTIADVAMVDEDNKYHLAPNVAKISINNKNEINPIFIMYTFMMTHNYIMSFASKTSQPSISMEKIRKFTYYFPPIELQNQFEEFVKLIDKQKIKLEKLIANYKTLKKGLMQQLLTGKVKVNV